MLNEKTLRNLFLQFCHDMANPINTITNLVEVYKMEDLRNFRDENIADSSETLHLLERSGEKAVVLLKVYRQIVLINGKSSERESIDFNEFCKTLLEHSKYCKINILQVEKRDKCSDNIPCSIAVLVMLLLIGIYKASYRKKEIGQIDIKLEMNTNFITVELVNAYAQSIGLYSIIEDVKKQLDSGTILKTGNETKNSLRVEIRETKEK